MPSRPLKLATIVVLALSVIGCTQPEIDAFRAENNLLRSQIAAVRLEVQSEPDAAPSKVAAIEKTLNRLDAWVDRADDAADKLEAASPVDDLTGAAKAITPFLPFPWNLVGGAAITALGLWGNRKRIQIKRALAPPPPTYSQLTDTAP